MDTEHHLGDYATLFPHKVSLFSLLDPEERIYLCRHYAVYAQQHIDHLLRRSTELGAERSPTLNPERTDDVLEVIGTARNSGAPSSPGQRTC